MLAVWIVSLSATAGDTANTPTGELDLPQISGSIVWPDCGEFWFVRPSIPVLSKPACAEFRTHDASRVKTAYSRALEAQGWLHCGDVADAAFFSRQEEQLMMAGLTRGEKHGEPPADNAYGVFLFVLVPKSVTPCS